jgi:hypothetical protein
MITEIEKLFIKTFIDKRIAERMIYEFDSTSKRVQGQDRFAHSTNDIINRKNLVKADKRLTVADMVAFVKEHSKSGLCYTVIGNDELEGKETTIQKAIEAADYYAGQSVVFAAPNAAVIIEEQSFGQPMRYLLLSNRYK